MELLLIILKNNYYYYLPKIFDSLNYVFTPYIQKQQLLLSFTKNIQRLKWSFPSVYLKTMNIVINNISKN